ncbi:MAG: ATP-binding protein, partial [Cyanobacteria bacterium P01_G01_bin.38]
MPHDSQQVQTFGDIAMGDGSVFTINQIIQVTAPEIQTRPLKTNSPYRGLKRFEVSDQDLFFGRDQLIARLIDNLKHHNHLLILGASGSGKSSVMRAGVVPQLISQLSDTLQTFTFTPDRNPFRSLWGCLVSSGFKQSDADCVLDDPDSAMLTLIKQHKPASAQWLFFIDQFEEIFTLCQDLDQRQSFIRNLLQASSLGKGAVKIVLAMRADFLDRFGGYPELGQFAQQNIYLITDMHPDELRLAIEQPAAKHGVVFEAGLVDEIIRDLEGQAGALPLLQYTLDLLWHRSDLGARTLSCKTYRELGGVRGALQQRVENLYGALDECDRTTTKQIFLRLIDITGAAEEMDVVGKAVSRRAALSEFDHEAAQKVLPQLIDANLLVSNRQDTSTVELAHETLINAWPKLKQWIDDSKEVIVMQNRL